jgi:flap endonuclease-1
MGVKLHDLTVPLRKCIELSDLQNKRISIDAFNVLYQFLATIRMDGNLLKDHQGNVTSHLSG